MSEPSYPAQVHESVLEGAPKGTEIAPKIGPGRPRGERICVGCGTQSSCLWRRRGESYVCNACGCRARRMRKKIEKATAERKRFKQPKSLNEQLAAAAAAVASALEAAPPARAAPLPQPPALAPAPAVMPPPAPRPPQPDAVAAAAAATAAAGLLQQALLATPEVQVLAALVTVLSATQQASQPAALPVSAAQFLAGPISPAPSGELLLAHYATTQSSGELSRGASAALLGGLTGNPGLPMFLGRPQ
eukprot:scaffold4.g4678.t1